MRRSNKKHRPPVQANGFIEDKALLALTTRIRMVLSGYTFASVGRKTGFSAESVRRYMLGDRPPVNFLFAICQHYDVSADWLLCGLGAPSRGDIVGQLTLRATASELCAAAERQMESTKQSLTELNSRGHQRGARAM